MSIFHIGTLYVKPECREGLMESFKSLSQNSGYISHTCYKALDNENKITLVENWESKQDHDNFLSSIPEEQMKGWLGMLSQDPEGDFYAEV